MKITEIEHRIMVKKTQSVVAKEYSHEVIKNYYINEYKLWN